MIKLSDATGVSSLKRNFTFRAFRFVQLSIKSRLRMSNRSGQPVNTLSVSVWRWRETFGVTRRRRQLYATRSDPSDPSRARHRLRCSANDENFVAALFASLTPNTAPWSPSPITLPAQPDFVVGRGVRRALRRFRPRSCGGGCCTNKRQYIAIMPGDYRGPCMFRRAGDLCGTGEKPITM